MVLVFDFGFGERGFVVHTPIHRAQALVDEVVLVEGVERLQHHRFVLRRHRGVRAIKTSEDANALELFPLQIEKLLRELTALAAHVERTHLQLLATKLLVNLDLDWQAVAVPSWDIGCVKSGHGFGLDYEILQAFIEGGAEVNGSAGVGRPIVEDIKW